MIKRVLLAATLAVPLFAGVLPHASAKTPKAELNTSGPMFCVWNTKIDISYCQYTFPKLP